MILPEAILPYIDGNGLISPNLADAKHQRSSDNSVLFASEYIVLSLKLGYPVDKRLDAIQACIGSDGELHRAPGDTTPDAPDDYYGAYASYVSLNIVPKFHLPIRLWQPALLFASRCAQQDFKRYKPYYIPLALLTAFIIGFSCMNAPKDQSTPRILAYLLTQATKASLLCRIGTYFFKRKLLKDYPEGMKSVYGIFFEPGHPLITYSVEF